MTILAFETSCDETSAAVVRQGGVLSSVVASQIRLHAEYGGVVPELATREHLRNLAPVATAAIDEAGVKVSDIEAVAATQGPGLPSALMVGFKAAQAMAFASRKPFLGLHHHEAHLYSAWISGAPLRADFDAFQPCVSLIVSGGHTILAWVPAELQHRVLGSTQDDAAGECFDKIAKLMGLPYPGGPELDRLASQGNPRAFAFPRPLLRESNDDFSFSGLKTAVRYFIRDHPDILSSRQGIHDLCASAQAAIVEVLVTKTVRAALRMGVRWVTVSGGVTCNRGLRVQMAEACGKAGLSLRLAERSLCTDNAAMIGILAERKFRRSADVTPWDAEVRAGWALA
jgi:N6-L-threonylcarbamoyladenine synthase